LLGAEFDLGTLTARLYYVILAELRLGRGCTLIKLASTRTPLTCFVSGVKQVELGIAQRSLLREGLCRH